MEYIEEVKGLLEAYHENIEAEVIPGLEKDFEDFYGSLTELIGRFKSKGLLKDDPYSQESEVNSIIIPDTDDFPHADASWKVPERLGKFEKVLSYIANNYSFNLATFNFEELEKLKKIIDYYRWDSLLKPSISEINTKSLGKIVYLYRSSNPDPLLLKSFDYYIETIIKCKENILLKLQSLLLYLKESYKQFIRLDLLPIIKEKNPNLPNDQYLFSINTEIKENYSYLKSYKKYITEVVNEEFASNEDALKATVIKKLSAGRTAKKKEAEEKKVDSSKTLLLTLLEIGKIRTHLDASIEKLNINHISLSEKKSSFIKRVLKKISKALFNVTDKTMYNFTINMKTSKKEISLHFEAFYNDIKKLEFDLLNIAEEDKASLFVIQTAEITQYIDRILIRIKKNLSISNALDEYLKEELLNKKIKVKGIKPELKVIKTLINNSTSLYQVYLEELRK